MKEYVKAILEVGLWLTGLLLKVIGGRRCKKMPRITSRSAINASDLPQTFINQGELLIHYSARGLSPNGAWISWDPSLKLQETRSTFWSAQTISPNGSKRNLWPTLEMWMYRSLCGRVLLLDLGFLILSSRTTAYSLIARHSGIIAASWEL